MVKRVESVHRAFTKKLPDVNALTYRERLSVLRLESLELRRLKADLIMCFKTLKGFTNIISSEFFKRSTCNTRGHSMKLYYPDSTVLARQNFFSVRVVQVWNNLPNEVVSATCVSVFKSLLNLIDVSFLALCFSDGLLLGSCKCSLSLSVQ